jgi:hypothetical protein
MSSFNKAFEDLTIGELKKLHESYLNFYGIGNQTKLKEVKNGRTKNN